MSEIYSAIEEIADVSAKRPHVVVLGAGASFAATPNGDRSGKRLPLMFNLIDVVGLRDILRQHKLDHLVAENFEDVYSRLYADPSKAAAVAEIEAVVDTYFKSLALPAEPTVYDHLVLSMRPKDVIATFNWDPFLFEACRRNRHVAPMPRVIFLHGNVAVGYCEAHRRKGPRHSGCPICGKPFTATRVLYPIGQKDYSSDLFIKAEWEGLRGALTQAFAITVFGYGAPKSDAEAVNLMKNAWGDIEDRELEQTEIIDIKSPDDLADTWEPFIHTHHYDVRSSFAQSWIRHHPRRTCEALWAQNLDVKFVENNPLPVGASFPELHQWLLPLLAAER